MRTIPRFLAAVCAAALLAAGAARAANDSIPVTPTVQSAAYAAGNALGGLLSLPIFRTTASGNMSGVLDAVQFSSKGGSTTPVTFYVFDKSPTATTCSDKAAFALGAADVDKLALAPFTLTPAATQGATVSTAMLAQSLSIANHDVPAANLLYACLVVGGAVTPASTTDVVVKFSGVTD